MKLFGSKKDFEGTDAFLEKHRPSLELKAKLGRIVCLACGKKSGKMAMIGDVTDKRNLVQAWVHHACFTKLVRKIETLANRVIDAGHKVR